LFRAGFAAAVLSRYGGRSCRVLDVPGGWGDRIIAAAAIGAAEIVTWDTNEHMRQPYANIAAATKANIVYYIEPFEDASKMFDINGKYYHYFDVAITSPPFYDIELYSGNKTSTTRYSNLTSWLQGFYKPLIMQLWASIRRGGYLCAYLPDDSPRQPLESAAKSYISGYLGVVGMPAGDKIRKMHIWRKKDVDVTIYRYSIRRRIEDYVLQIDRPIRVLQRKYSKEAQWMLKACSKYGKSCTIIGEDGVEINSTNVSVFNNATNAPNATNPSSSSNSSTSSNSSNEIIDGCNIPQITYGDKTLRCDIYVFDSPAIVTYASNMTIGNVYAIGFESSHYNIPNVICITIDSNTTVYANIVGSNYDRYIYDYSMQHANDYDQIWIN